MPPRHFHFRGKTRAICCESPVHAIARTPARAFGGLILAQGGSPKSFLDHSLALATRSTFNVSPFTLSLSQSRSRRCSPMSVCPAFARPAPFLFLFCDKFIVRALVPWPCCAVVNVWCY